MLSMPLYFQDVFGARGKISDTLEVSYSGRWEDGLEDFVAEMGDDTLFGGGGPEMLDGANYLLIELPKEFPIREISRDCF